jgi:hypothetical protein
LNWLNIQLDRPLYLSQKILFTRFVTIRITNINNVRSATIAKENAALKLTAELCGDYAGLLEFVSGKSKLSLVAGEELT